MVDFVFSPSNINSVTCADCLDFMAKIPDNSIPLTVLSCPYDDIRSYDTPYIFNYKPVLHALNRITMYNGMVCWTVGDQTNNWSVSGSSYRQAIFAHDEVGFKMREIIYIKPYTRHTHPNMYASCHEHVFLFLKGDKPRVFNPILRKNKHAGKPCNSDTRLQDGSMAPRSGYKGKLIKEFGIERDVWEISNSVKKRDVWMPSKSEIKNHPAVMPKQLAGRLIYTFSDVGDIVLDIFCGFGTTLVAAKEMNRNYLGCDISENYVQMARERLRQTEAVSLLWSCAVS